MEMPIMSAFVKHINQYVRQFCPQETYLLCLDGHSSRKGIEWIEECMKNGCEAVVSPANTSYFLQACDQTVNKRFKEAMRELRDEFCKLGTVDTRQVNFNLACGVYAFDQITAKDIINSFQVTGIFPLDRKFPLRYLSEQDKSKNKAEAHWSRIEDAGPASRLKSVILRKSDKETLGEVHKILESKSEACRQLQELAVLLKKAETTNNILMGAGYGISRETNTAQSRNTPKAVMIDPGAPAEWVTVKELLERRKEKEAEEVRVQKEKEAEKVRKEAARIERLAREKITQVEKEKDKERKRIEKEMAKETEKRRKVVEAVEKERRVALRKTEVERAKELARKAKADAAELAQRSAGVWRLENPHAKRRGRKRTLDGNEKFVPYQRSFNYAATLVIKVVDAATTCKNVEDAVQN